MGRLLDASAWWVKRILGQAETRQIIKAQIDV